MIDCDKVKEYISDYIEKGLSPDLKSELDNHFQQCHSCNLIVQSIPQIQSLMQNLATVQCTDDFNLKLRQRIADDIGSFRFSGITFKRFSYGFSFALLIFVIVLGFNLFNPAEQESDLGFPQVQKNESVNPTNTVNTNLNQNTANKLTQSEELDVRTKDGDGIYADSLTKKSDEIKDKRVKYVDTQ